MTFVLSMVLMRGKDVLKSVSMASMEQFVMTCLVILMARLSVVSLDTQMHVSQ